MSSTRGAVIGGAAAALFGGAFFASASAGEISTRIDDRLELMIDSRVDVTQVAQASLADRLSANLPAGVTLGTATPAQLEAMFAIVSLLEPTVQPSELAAAAAVEAPGRAEEIAAIVGNLVAAARDLDPTDPEIQDEIDLIANEIGNAIADALGVDDIQRESLIAAASAGALAGIFLPAAGDVDQIALVTDEEPNGVSPFAVQVIQRESEDPVATEQVQFGILSNSES